MMMIIIRNNKKTKKKQEIRKILKKTFWNNLTKRDRVSVINLLDLSFHFSLRAFTISDQKIHISKKFEDNERETRKKKENKENF